MKPRHFLTLLATSATALVLHPTAARAVTTNLSPTSAFRIGTWAPDLHDTSLLSVYNIPADNTQHSILLFDFSSLPGGVVIDSAVLTLYKYGGWEQPTGTQSEVSALAVPWDASATWNNASVGNPWTTPGGDVTGAAYATNSEVIGAGYLPVTWDVTSLIAAWTSGSLPNYGLLLSANPGDSLHFDPLSPTLTISYVPEPASAMLLLFGTALCVRRRRLGTQGRSAD